MDIAEGLGNEAFGGGGHSVVVEVAQFDEGDDGGDACCPGVSDLVSRE